MAFLEFIFGLLEILSVLVDLVCGAFEFLRFLFMTPARRRAKREQKLMRQIEARISNNDGPVSS